VAAGGVRDGRTSSLQSHLLAHSQSRSCLQNFREPAQCIFIEIGDMVIVPEHYCYKIKLLCYLSS
jgi:hypothetical protein